MTKPCSRTADDYRRMKFRYAKEHVTRSDRDNHVLELGNKGNLSYDRLLIAVGAQVVRLKVPGANLDGVLKLDHMEDAKHILKFARRGRTAVVVGGRITALELVEGLVARGVKVHYLRRGDRYWGNVLDEQESKIVEHRLQEEGVKLHYHAEIVEVTGKKDRINGVRLADGKLLKCDLVTYAIGIRPRVELAKQAGVEVDRGILVNEYMQTNVGAAVATPGRPVCCVIGDGAMGFHPQEITAVRHRLPIVWLVLADRQWGMVKMNQSFALRPLKMLVRKRLDPGENIWSDLGEIRFDDLARSMGAHGERVPDPPQLRPALERSRAAGKCAVIHVDVNPVSHMWAPGLLHFKDMHQEPKGE